MVQTRHDHKPTMQVPGHRQHGSVMVEFALTGMIYFTMLFAAMDYAYLFFGNLSMQHAVREGARYAVTGQSGLDPNPTGTAQDRCDAAIALIKDQSMGFYDIVQPVVTFQTVNDDGSLSTVPANSCAAANDIVVIRVACSLKALTPFLTPFFTNVKYSFLVSATMKNEGFQ
jgi:Flp pilus assembly protein TadG